MKKGKRRNGFSLIEVIVTLSVMVILSVVGLLSLTSRKGSTNLTDGAKQIVAALREAQSHSMVQDKGVAWGVHFSNVANPGPFFALFSSSYSAANTAGYYRLPDGVAFVTSSLPVGSTTDIIFTQVSGGLGAQRTIVIYLPTQALTQSSTIVVSQSGAVSY